MVLATIIWSLVFHFIIFGVYLTFLEAVIFILKHTTFLRLLSLSSESALACADLHYQEANFDLKIQEYLLTTSQVQSVMQYECFIMATDISLFILTSVKWLSHLVCAESIHLWPCYNYVHNKKRSLVWTVWGLVLLCTVCLSSYQSCYDLASFLFSYLLMWLIACIVSELTPFLLLMYYCLYYDSFVMEQQGGPLLIGSDYICKGPVFG